MKSRKRIASLILCAALVIIMLGATVSISRYVFDEEKNISGNYADFIMSNNGNGQTVIMRKNADDSYTGYIAVNINNFADEKISKRDVKFYLREPSEKELTDGTVSSAWGKEFTLKDKSGYYHIEMVNNKDEKYIDAEGKPVSGHETEADELTTLAADGNKNTSAILLKITRKAKRDDVTPIPEGVDKFAPTALMTQNVPEHLTIVLQATQPYSDLQVFDITATEALISIGVTSDTYQGYSERIVNIKTSTDFVWKETNGTDRILVDNKYLAKIHFKVKDNVILDEYRFNESYDTSFVLDKANSRYTLILKPGADIFLHFYVLGPCSVTATAQLDYEEANKYKDVKISGTGNNNVVFEEL